MFWRFYQLGSAKVPYFNCCSCQRVYVERLGLYFSYLSSWKLNEEQIAGARSMGLRANCLPEASLGNVVSIAAVQVSMVTQRDYWKRGCGEILIVILVSFFRAVSVSLELQTRSEKFSSRSMEMPDFFKTSAIKTPRQSFLLEGLNRFSLNKYPSFWEKLPNFVLNEHWQVRQFSDAIPLYIFQAAKKLPCWL